MIVAPLPPDEAERLAALRSYEILDTSDEPSFDRLTQLAATLFEVPIALISLVDTDRQWFKSCIGLNARQTTRDVAFCSHAILSPEPLVIPDARADVRFADNPLVTGPPHIRFYAGAPLKGSNGKNLGTMCIIDHKPRQLDAQQRQLLADLAALVVDEMDLRLSARARFLLDKVAATTPNYFYVFELETRKIVWSNRDLAEWLGYTSQQAADIAFRLQLVHPDDLSAVNGRIDKFHRYRDGELATINYRMRDASARWRWFLARERIFERDLAGRASHVVGVATDITELKETELALEQSRASLTFRVALLENIFDSVAEGICVANAEGHIVTVNRAAERIAGLRPTTAPNQQWPEQHGAFRPDGVTPFSPDELPLVRTLAGEIVDDVDMVLSNPRIPTPVRLQINGRPLRDEAGAIQGGVVTFRDVTALRAAETELERLALTDEMTGLPNLRAFRERLQQMLLEAERGRKFALLMLDVDHFKQVNDTYGHDGGDDVLRAVARTLRQSVRRVDMAARYGGEEFCVLYGDVDADTALLLADRLRLAVASADCPIRVTCSIGLCAHPGVRHGPDGEGMLHAADTALYQAKRGGRNRVVIAG